MGALLENVDVGELLMGLLTDDSDSSSGKDKKKKKTKKKKSKKKEETNVLGDIVGSLLGKLLK